MPTWIPYIVDVVLFAVTFLWVGAKPTVPKVLTMIAVIALANVSLDLSATYSQGQGFDLFSYYADVFKEQGPILFELLSISNDELESAVFGELPKYLPAMYIVGASCEVFPTLLIAWIFHHYIRRDCRWSMLSRIDLSVWWVALLIAGIVLFAISCFPNIADKKLVLTIAVNVMIISVVPLFVQGAAATKGLMNRHGWRYGLQVLVVLWGIVTMTFLIVLPVTGLIDFWANFRKLKRENSHLQQED